MTPVGLDLSFRPHVVVVFMTSSFGLLPGPLDHGLGGAVEEDEFGVQVLLELELARLAHQEDVGAEFEDSVHTRELLEHDGVRDATEELAHELPDHQHHRCVQAHDPAGDQHLPFNHQTITEKEHNFSQLTHYLHNL